MSIARHHNEWLSLVPVSGPFLSMPVLMRVFPQGLGGHEPEHFRTLRLAYEVWSERKNDLAMIRQALVDQKKKRYVIKSHLKELLQESGDE